MASPLQPLTAALLLLLLSISLTCYIAAELEIGQEQLQQQQKYYQNQPDPSTKLPYYISALLVDNGSATEPEDTLTATERIGQRSQLPKAVQMGRVKLDATQRGFSETSDLPDIMQMQSAVRSPVPQISSSSSSASASSSSALTSTSSTSSSAAAAAASILTSSLPTTTNTAESTTGCLYDRTYFAKLDECLARKPYPTIGLPAFKNEDLLIKKSPIADRQGCLFVLNNGLFKSYQIPKYSIDNNNQCLDNTRVAISMGFTNISLSYLWTLRCLNRADQLLNDATLNGETSINGAGATTSSEPQVCVGSSQNFGFASMQLSGIDAELELALDIYKNWRVTNVTVSMQNPTLLPASSARTSGAGLVESDQQVVLGTAIRDFVFESLDGDELNWRYLNMFQNWSRNRIHSNFLDQYRRFIWISLQRCLSEYTEKLPVKLLDIFSGQKTN